MSSPSETTLIVLATALQAEIISRNTAEFWQLVTAIGLTITPLLARIGHDIARRIELRTGDAQSDDTPEGRTVIVGFGRVGHTVAELLREHGRPYIAVDADIDTVAAARRDGFIVRFADVARPGALDKLAIETANAIVLTMDDPVQQLRMTRQLRRNIPICRSSAARATPTMQPRSIRRARTTRCPKRSKARCNLPRPC
jgi:CPA2 family monovalent cation:H+ antiporter-2